MERIRILIVANHPAVQTHLRAAIQSEPDLEIVAEAVNGRQALQQILDLHPDVTVLSLDDPDHHAEAVSQTIPATISSTLMAADPCARILVITSPGGEDQGLSAIQAGALGCLSPDPAQRQILEGIREVAQGRLFLPPEITGKLAKNPNQNHFPPLAHPIVIPLTPREQQVLECLGAGLSNQAIAQKLHLSESTIRVSVYNLFSKLGIQNRSQAIVYAIHQAHHSPT